MYISDEEAYKLAVRKQLWKEAMIEDKKHLETKITKAQDYVFRNRNLHQDKVDEIREQVKMYQKTLQKLEWQIIAAEC